MAIVSADLVFVASERMIDNLSTTGSVGGGGKRGTLIVQDGEDNNVFPDVAPADRLTGRVQVRLVYPSVLSANADMLSSSYACVLARPTDPLVEICAFLVPASTKSYDAVTKLQTSPAGEVGSNIAGTWDRDGSIANRILTNGVSSDLQVGEFVNLGVNESSLRHDMRVVTAANPGAYWFEFSGGSAFSSGADIDYARRSTFSAGARFSAAALTTGSSSGGATTVTVDRAQVRVVPVGASAATPGLVNSEYHASAEGLLPCFLPGDVVLIQHASNPATFEIARLTATDPTGVGVLTFDDPLTNAYASGSKVSALLPLGDLVARLDGTPFSQQSWMRVWSDTASGTPIPGSYSQSIDLTNDGTIDDRWACVFRTSTTFDLYSERFGHRGTGSTATDFMPLNPMTNEPYFTLHSSGWGSGWLVGNVLRFNTRAASAGIWVSRCVSPGAASGTQVATLAFMGGVDA